MRSGGADLQGHWEQVHWGVLVWEAARKRYILLYCVYSHCIYPGCTVCKQGKCSLRTGRSCTAETSSTARRPGSVGCVLGCRIQCAKLLYNCFLHLHDAISPPQKVYPSGVYEGGIVKRKREGNGSMYHSDGSLAYNGNWRGDTKEGALCGAVYGSWVDIVLECIIPCVYASLISYPISLISLVYASAGDGVAYYQDHSIYSGLFYRNLRHGHGCLMAQDGAVIYEGAGIAFYFAVLCGLYPFCCTVSTAARDTKLCLTVPFILSYIIGHFRFTCAYPLSLYIIMQENGSTTAAATQTPCPASPLQTTSIISTRQEERHRANPLSRATAHPPCSGVNTPFGYCC